MLVNILRYIIYIYKQTTKLASSFFFFPYKSNSFPNLLSDVRWPFLFTETNSFSVHQEFSRRNMAMKPVKYYVVLCVCVCYNLICMCYLFMNGSLSWYWQVDAFTDSVFKGNPAVVCFLEEDQRTQEWLQVVAAEFNIPTTCYLTHLTQSNSPNPRFRHRWFTPVAEVCTFISIHDWGSNNR